MSDNNDGLYVRLFTEREEPEDYERYIHGPEPDSDTIGKALKRFSDDSGITQGQISLLTGISRSCLYYYCKDQRKIGYENLILLCVALRLHPLRQEYLFSLTPHKVRKSDPRYSIIRLFLANCAFMEKYTVKALNECIKAEGNVNIEGGTLTLKHTGIPVWDEEDSKIKEATGILGRTGRCTRCYVP